MAVSEQTPYIEYTANGTATSFALEFDCESADHLIVSIDDLEVLHTDWYLSGNAIMFHVAPANGKQVKIQRNTPFNRLADYQSYNNSFRPPAINKDFDRIWWKLQELGVADWLMKLYVDQLHQQQEQKINDLRGYVDDQDDEIRAYLMEEIRKQGVALDQLDEYYNYLMERLAQIAVDKGWDASFVVDGDKTQKQINDLNKSSEYIFKPSAASDHTAELQAAIDYCAANFLNCKPIGLFKTSGKVVIKGEFDGSRCRVQTQVYGPITSTPIAVEVSTGVGENPTTIISLTESERIILPDVVNGTKPAVGWEGQGIGVRYVNVQNTQITERLVQDFAIGIQHTAYTQGCGYNTVTAGYLRNNKVNRQFIVGDLTGWTNRWDLYGGRYFHSSAEGQNVTGCMHFDVVPNAAGNIINDINHFGGSFEGLSEQYHIRLGGAYINFYGIRFENRDTTGGIKVHLASAGLDGQGSANSFVCGRGVNADDGATADRLRVTKDVGVGNVRIAVISSNATSYVSAAGIVEVKKSTSSSTGFIYCGVDATFEYGENISTNYSFGISASALHGKRKTDTNDRIKLDFLNGRTYYGRGADAPSLYIGQQGSNALATNSNWIPQANAAHTLGATGFSWDRLFLANGFGAFGVAPLLTQPTITGKKTPATIAEQNAVLDSIISALSAYGLVADNRT